MPPLRRCHRADLARRTSRAFDLFLSTVPGGGAVSESEARLQRILDELSVEFPRFRIRKKRTSVLQRAIHVTLAVLTLGGTF